MSKKTRSKCPSCGEKIEILGRKELADLLGWDARHITTYRKRGHIPPDFELHSGPVWFKDNPDIKEFIKKHKKNKE